MSFEQFKTDFAKTKLGQRMLSTVEDSPYHREANVWVHTEMVLSKFSQYSEGMTDKQILMGQLACLFHDVGKPSCEQVKHSEEKGEYRSYTGHENKSSRMWEDFYMTQLQSKGIFHTVLSSLTAWELMAIQYMIAFHLAYRMNEKKMNDLVATIAYLSNKVGFDLHQVYKAVLRSDGYGRITDNQEATRSQIEDTILMYETSTLQKENAEYSKPLALYLVGASGTGKSSYVAKLKEQGLNVLHYSWDDLRLALFAEHQDKDIYTDVDLYEKAFQYGQTHSSELTRIFKVDLDKKRKMAIASNLQNIKTYLVIDNTNLTNKKRGEIFHQLGSHFQHYVVLTPVALDTVLNRQYTRKDKQVNPKIVKTMYYTVELPLIGKQCQEIILNH